MLGPTLNTERLILRPPTLADLPDWAALLADPESAQYIGGVQPLLFSWRSLMATAGSWALQGFSMFSVIERATNRWVGRVGPWRPEGWPGNEIGWALSRSARGRGYATEAATAAMNWAFDVLHWPEVIHVIQPANTPSVRVAERLGSTRQGPVSLPPPSDTVACEAWGQTRAQWRARRVSVAAPHTDS